MLEFLITMVALGLALLIGGVMFTAWVKTLVDEQKNGEKERERMNRKKQIRS